MKRSFVVNAKNLWQLFFFQDGTSISNSENFQAVAKRCYDLNPKQIIAIGVNCLSPNLVEQLFAGINDGREGNPVALIAYPNSGERYDAVKGSVTFCHCDTKYD